MRIQCPMCKTVVTSERANDQEAHAEQLRWRPFCSRRCKLLDLGNWLDERYRISGPPTDHDLDALGDDDPALN